VTKAIRRGPERLGPERTTGPVEEGRVEVSRAGGCVTATLTWKAARKRVRDGARNARDRAPKLTGAMARQLIDLAEEVEDDADALMLAIRGADGDFCAGFERDVDSMAPSVVESIAVLSKPTLAIIDGVAADEGLELALATDLRVATRAARFTMGQLGRGRLPCFGGTQRLPRLIGAADALRMLLTGATVDGNAAMRLGLVTYVASSPAGLERMASEVVRSVTSRGPIAARLAKEAVRKGCDLTLDQGIRLEEDLYALLQTTADRAEGVRAFLDKRKPLFRGA
jgi:enoyl-CoA hydratase/carnithine racemase